VLFKCGQNHCLDNSFGTCNMSIYKVTIARLLSPIEFNIPVQIEKTDLVIPMITSIYLIHLIAMSDTNMSMTCKITVKQYVIDI
jgi:hypothetical protein